MKKALLFIGLKVAEICVGYCLLWRLPLWAGHFSENQYAKEFPYSYAAEGFPIFDQWFYGIEYIFGAIVCGFILLLIIEGNISLVNNIIKKKKKKRR